MLNQFSFTFFGNVQSKIVTKLQNNVLKSEIHDITITANLLEILEMLPGIHLEHGIKCFPLF